MKSVYIITLSCAHNYGAVLQTFGLYKQIQNMGYDVKVIDYIPFEYDTSNAEYKNNFLMNSDKWNKNFLTRFIYKNILYKNYIRNSIPFRNFVIKNIKLTKKCINKNDFETLKKADIYITGSDQVWNSDFLWGRKIDENFYLDFAPKNARKISYASSFGKTKFTKDEISLICDKLKKYNAISVREDSAANFLRNNGINADVNVDPTILCNFDEFNNIASSRIINEKYALCFLINFDVHIINDINKYCKKQNFKLVVVSSSISNKIKYPGTICLPKVEDWLSYFKYAEIVFTDSFHGTVFSTLFQKQFFAITRNKYNRYLDRINQYCNMLSINNRIIDIEKSDFQFSLINDDIDYKTVTPKIQNAREKSIKWLESNL